MPVTPDPAGSHDALDHQPKSSGVPAYMTADQDAANAACAVTTSDRLLLRTLWESGGRVSEVASLRLRDTDRTEGAL